MKKYKYLTYLFAALAIILSNVMCTVVAYNYCALWWGGQYGICSAPANAAFFLCIPYGIGIMVCVVMAWFFNRKHKMSS